MKSRVCSKCNSKLPLDEFGIQTYYNRYESLEVRKHCCKSCYKKVQENIKKIDDSDGIDWL